MSAWATKADLVVIAPATADLLAKAATGQAGDLLTNTLLMAHGPVLFAPAMHTEMWQHAATRANVETLRSRGVAVLEPATGRLTGSDSGSPAGCPAPRSHFRGSAMALVEGQSDYQLPLAGRTVTISAGGTREPLDPVRFLGNRSSGKQGVALARPPPARNAGATVRLIAAHMEVPPSGRGGSGPGGDCPAELREAGAGAAADSDVVIMSAAVADFRPAEVSSTKIKKRPTTPRRSRDHTGPQP